MKKRILSIFLACVMLLSVFSVSVCAVDGVKATKSSDAGLQFDENGKFQIMIFSDVQDDTPIEETTIQMMCESLDKYEPDLVVFLGDNGLGASPEAQKESIEEMLQPCIDRNVPFTMVLGNHDPENGNTPEELLEHYQKFGCLTYDADPEMYGCGNSNLTIRSSDGEKVAFNLWFFDSGSSNPDTEVGGYDYVRKSQIEWYEKTAAELKEENGGEVVTSLLFQHIIMTEIYEYLYPVSRFNLGKDYTYNGVSYYPVPSFSKHDGIILEPCSPSRISEGQFDSIVETGDVLAMFHGHDHVNDFTATYQGIDIVNVPTVGDQAYSDAVSRGAGLITLDEKDLTTYDYEMIYFFDMALEDDSLLTEVDGGKSKLYYTIVKNFRKFINGVHDMFR